MESESLDLLESLQQMTYYEGFLMLAGLTACFFALRRLPKLEQLGFPGTTPWMLKVPDFILFLCLFFVWYLTASTIAFYLAEHFTPEGQDAPGWALAGGTLLLHLGLIVLFWRWREMHRAPTERGLNRAQLSLPQALGQGVFCFLVSVVLVYGVALVWHTALSQAQAAGFSVNLAPQTAVELFTQAKDLASFVTLAFVAVVAAPIAEELIFRAGIYRFLNGRIGRFSAAMATGLSFGFLHANLVGFIPLSLFGVLLCLIYEVTGNIKVPIIVHALFNLNTLVLLVITVDRGAAG
jgi:hypothetical protein